METKLCLNCGRRYSIKNKNCPYCHSKQIDIENKSGKEFYATTVRLFQNVGWEVKTSKNPNEPDLFLYHNGILEGYVQVIRHLSQKAIVGDLNILKAYLSNRKPKVVILTNLTTFYVRYADGKFEQVNYVPTSSHYPFVKQIIDEFLEDFSNKENKKDGDK